MNKFGSRPNHENRTIYEELPTQGLSEVRWAGVAAPSMIFAENRFSVICYF
jgi:hypothetical protein